MRGEYPLSPALSLGEREPDNEPASSLYPHGFRLSPERLLRQTVDPMKQLITALLLLLALGGGTAFAAPAWHEPGNIRVAQNDGVSLDQAVAQVRRDTGGRILSAETVRENGRKVHRIKVLTRDNKVRIVRIEAE